MKDNDEVFDRNDGQSFCETVKDNTQEHRSGSNSGHLFAEISALHRGEEVVNYQQQLSILDQPNENDWVELNGLIRDRYVQDVRDWFHNRGLGSTANQFWTINSYWPLQVAAEAGCIEIFNVLLEYGFDPMEENFMGDGLIHTAARAGHTEMMRRILQLGLTVFERDRDDNTPLHFAARKADDNSRMIKFLVRRRANPNERNCFEETPLHIAASKGSINSVHALVEAGACVNARLSTGLSPLFHAINRRTGAEEHVRTLCDLGATSGSCQRRFCEFYAACRVGRLAVIAMLVKRNFCMSCDVNSLNATPLYNMSATMDAVSRKRAVDVIVGAGYDVRADIRWIKDTSMYPVNSSEIDSLQRQVLVYATTPRSLRQISCFVIRKVLGSSFTNDVDYLPLPDILKDIVRLKDVLK